MKILLSLIICSQVAGTCMPPYPWPETFNNTYVRKGQVVGNTRAHTVKLINWIKQKYQKEIRK